MNSKKKHHPDISLNLNVRGLKQSATLAINEHSKRLISQGKKVYKLGLGQSPFPVPDPVVKKLQEHAHEKAYLPVKGLEELRSAVANYHCRTEGLHCSAEDVFIGPGSKELMFVLQLVYYGDLIIPIPSWVSYAPQASIIGRNIRWVPTYLRDRWRITPEELEDICRDDPNRPRIVILNYPNNPSGSTYRLEELKGIAAVARKYRVILLSDEIYGELHHTGQHVSIARFYPEGTIISSGLSKWCGAGGWRLGTFTFPESLRWLLEAMAVVASETYTATSAPIQYAAVRAFEGGPEIEEYLVRSRRVLRVFGRYIFKRLIGTGLLLPEPKGGFYLYPDFTTFADRLRKRGITTSYQLCERLLEETGVAILPGSFFGAKPEELSARLAYVDFDGAGALAALKNIPANKGNAQEFIKANAGPLVLAVDEICNWLDKKE